MRTRFLTVFGAVAALSALVVSSASAVTTYDIAPVTTSITDQIAASLPTILAVVGGLLALGLVIKGVRKFAKI